MSMREEIYVHIKCDFCFVKLLFVRELNYLARYEIEGMLKDKGWHTRRVKVPMEEREIIRDGVTHILFPNGMTTQHICPECFAAKKHLKKQG